MNKHGEYEMIIIVMTLSILFIFPLIHAGMTGVDLERSCTEEDYLKTNIQIYSLVLGEDVHGSFILGTGSIKETNYYYFYRAEQGGMILDKVRAEDVVIKELGKGELPVYQTINKKKYMMLTELCVGEQKKDILYVPKNTIKKVYDVNLKTLEEK